MFERNLFGLEKDGSIKVWNIEVVGFERDFGLMKISHGKQGGKLTLKSETFVEGKQGRTPVEQAISEAQSRVTKQIKKGYRDSVEELTDLPILAMLSKDHTKAPKSQEEKIKQGVFTSDKLDGIRLMAFCKLVEGAKTVILKSRTGEVIELPHIAAQLLTVMVPGEIFDGEAYLHGPQLQDINSAVQRTDTQAKIEEATRKILKLENAGETGSEKHTKAVAELENALLIHDLRPKLEFHVFDVIVEDKLDSPFKDRLADLYDIAQRFSETTHIKQVVYRVAYSIEELTEQLHDCINRGYEGIMYRMPDGIYESGKRSSGLFKFKLFFDEEFKIVGSHKDKQGFIVFELVNNINDYEFNCVLGDYDWRLAVADDDFTGQWMTVKFQSRNKGTLIPQFGTGKTIRKGYVNENGEFTPSE